MRWVSTAARSPFWRSFSSVCIGELPPISLEETQFLQVSQLISGTSDCFRIVPLSKSPLNETKQELTYHLLYLPESLELKNKVAGIALLLRFSSVRNNSKYEMC